MWDLGILVPWPGMEPMSPVLEAQSLNHWIAREDTMLTFCVGNSLLPSKEYVTSMVPMIIWKLKTNDFSGNTCLFLVV